MRTKKYFICLTFILLILLVTIIVIFTLTKYMCPENKDINFNIRKVEISLLNDISLREIKEEQKYFDCKISNKQRKEILENKSNYKEVTFYYTIENTSNDVEIKDVRFNPIFDANIKNDVIAYNDGDMITYINLKPNEKRKKVKPY